MISTADFRNGLVFEWEKNLYEIIEFLHVKPGKGGAFVRSKLRNLRTGFVEEKTFRAGEKMQDVRLEERSCQFLYSQDDDYNFMDTKTFEQFTLSKQQLGDNLKYLKENMVVYVQYNKEEILAVKVPMFIEVEITQTEPGLKGDTVSGGNKPATIETGAIINVPLFINIGDIIKVDTRTGIYVERISK